MRHTPPKKLEQGRLQRAPYLSDVGAMWGMFEIHGPGRYKLRILSSGARHDDHPVLGDMEEAKWEHVSVSVKGKRFCPTWEEMCFVKDLFWDEEETVIQFHPPRSEYINTHSYTLHLWKPPYPLETPPAITVGIPGLELTR